MRIGLGAANWHGIAAAVCLSLAATPVDARAPAKKPAGKQQPAGKAAGGRVVRPTPPPPRGPGPAPELSRLVAERATLPSGLRLVVARSGAPGRVAVATSFGVGRAHEGPGELGAADALGGWLARAAAFDATLVASGATSRVQVDDDTVTVTTEGAREELERLVDAHLRWLVARGGDLPGEPGVARRLEDERRLYALVYQGFPPYAGGPRPPASPAAQEAFLRAARSAPRAVLAVVGDVEPHVELERVRARAPSAVTPVRAATLAGALPEQTNQRSEELAGDEEQLVYGWALRGATDAELAALELARHVITARIAAAGSADPRLATRGARASLDLRSGPSAWVLRVIPAPGADAARLRTSVERALSTLGAEPVDATTLAAAQRASGSARLEVREVPGALATELARGAHLAGGWVGRVEPHLGQVSAAALQGAAARHLGPLTRSVLVVRAGAVR